MNPNEMPSLSYESNDVMTVEEFLHGVQLGSEILLDQWPVYVVAHTLQRQWRVKRVEASAAGLWIVVKDD